MEKEKKKKESPKWPIEALRQSLKMIDENYYFVIFPLTICNITEVGAGCINLYSLL